MKTEKNYFQKFIYLAAVQLILVSQLLVITGSITTPAYAESGSGSEGTIETTSDNSGSGSSSEEVSSGSGTSGGDLSPTDESAGAVEQTDGSKSGSGSGGSEEQTSNSGSGNTDQQALTEEAVTEEVATTEATAPTDTAGTTVGDIAEEPATTTETIVAEGDTAAIEEVNADAPGDTINVAPEGTAPEGTPTTILEQVVDPAAGEIDPAIGFPTAYQDATGVSVTPCLDGTDPTCVLPGAGEEPNFDPSQPTVLGENFPSEFFYWIAESDSLDTPNGGKTFIRTALEGAFLNEEPAEGDQMVFGRIRVTGTGLEPNSEYTVTHPYGVDIYTTDEGGIIKRGEGTEDIGCFGAPCNFAEALGSRVFDNFLRWDSGAPVGTLGDAVTPHTVVGSPIGQNFFRIGGPGLPFEGLFTNLFTVAGNLLSGEFIPAVGEAPQPAPIVPQGQSAAGEVEQSNGFPVSYTDALGTSVVACLDGTDPICVLPGAGEEPNFDPSQPAQFTSNFPSEFFYWIAESDLLETPNGGKTFFRMAVEGAFLNEDPLAGDQMVFGRLRLTGTGLEPNSVYTVTHPYGVDTYMTDELGTVRRGEGTEDIGCFGAPCNFAAALQSRVFEGFLKWDSGAPVGTLGDAVTPHTVTGSPAGNNFFRIEGPGLGEGGLFTNLFTVAGKLLTETVLPIVGGIVPDGDTPDGVDAVPAEEPAVAPDPATETDIVEPVIDTDLPGDAIPDTLDAEVLPAEEVGGEEEAVVEEEPEEEEAEVEDEGGLAFGDLPLGDTAGTVADTGNVTVTDQAVTSDQDGSSSSSSSQTSAASTSSSDNSSDNGSSSSNSGTSGGSEAELRGSEAEGEVAGVDEELALGAFAEGPALVLGTEEGTSEDIVSEEGAQPQLNAVAQEEQQQQQEGANPLEILLALAALAIAGGLISGSAPGNLNLRQILHNKKGLRLR